MRKRLPKWDDIILIERAVNTEYCTLVKFSNEREVSEQDEFGRNIVEIRRANVRVIS